MPKVKDKDKILKAAIEKELATYKRYPIRLKACLEEIMEPRSTIQSAQREKTVNQQSYIQHIHQNEGE